MATWSSFEKDRLLAENWRKFVKDNPEDKNSQTVFGINSKDNPESLLSFLKKNQGAIGLTPEQVNQLVALMLAQTKEDDVVLEAIGGPQRDARTFSSDTTTKLNALINTFQLSPANKKKLEKILNRWAKLNTVSFEQGTPATPVVPEYEPDEDEQASTEKPKGIDYEPYGATDATPEKRADNLVVKQKGNFDAETGLPISKEGRDSIINQIAAATKQKEFYLLYQKLANSKFSNNDKKDSFNTAFRNNDYRYLSGFGAGSEAQQTIRQKFIDLFLTDEEEAETDRIKPVSSTKPVEQPDEKNPAQTFVDFLNGIEAEGHEEITVELFNNFVRDLTSYIKDIKKKKSIKEIARTQAAPKLKLSASQLGKFLNKNPEYKVIFNRLRWADKDSNALDSFLRAFEQVAKSLPADTPAEPEAPTPDAPAEPEVNREPESEREDTEPDLTEELESYIEEVKKKIKLYNTSDSVERRLVLPITTDVIKDFRFKYKDLVQKKAKKPFMGADAEFYEFNEFLTTALNKKTYPYELKAKYIDHFIKKMEEIKNQLTFKNALDIFKKVVEPVKQFLLSQANPEPSEEEGERDETPKAQSKPKKEKPPAKNEEAYEHGKQGKAMSLGGVLRDRRVVNIDNTIRGMRQAKVQTNEEGLKDKIESYIDGLQDFQDENEALTKLEESLMLRWKTIAGIK